MDACSAMASKQLSLVETDSIGAQGSSPELDSNRTLDEIVRSAQHATGASGAALVLSDGKIMSCRACSGELAPPVGTRLNPDSGFTASCVQSGAVVRCDDTQTDPRVDGSSCIELGIRSILAVPVCDGGNVAGVLEVLSREPRKFTDRHAKALQLLARLIETLVDYVSRGDGSASLLTLDAKAQEADSAKATTGETKLTCLSCGHPNPSDSQFCNRCGVILLSSPGSADTGVAVIANDGVESNADEGLKEIYKLISGNGGLATWNEIYARLLGNLQSASRQEKPAAAGGEKIARQDDTVLGFGSARGPTELKSRLGPSIRQNLWL
jgi:hypothetical protein